MGPIGVTDTVASPYPRVQEEQAVKFMVAWEIHPEKRHEALQAFAQMTDADDEADRGGVKLIGRWHDLGAGRGVAICESDDLGAVSLWALNWNSVLDPEISPVLDDDEAKEVARKKFSLG
jgi:hypothetical protein